MSGPGPCRIYLAAGEVSGDMHAARVARALRALNPDAAITATGGAALEAEGAAIRHSIDQCGVMGLVETVRAIPRHARMLHDLNRRFRDRTTDLLVVVDYPGFHLRLAQAAARQGVPVLFYIAPQLWAWGAHRARRLAAAARRLAVVLPFEAPFFQRHGIRATFVGHPLLDAPPPPPRAAARRTLGLPPEAPTLALVPGSRPQEIARLWPVMRDAARSLRHTIPELRVVVAARPGSRYSGAEDCTLWRGPASEVMAAADAGLCKSGTTTLEAALAGLPMVVTYRMHPVTFAVARRAVRVPWISLVNLVAGRAIVPELLQRRAGPEQLAATVRPLLDRDGRAARDQRSGFLDVRGALGDPGASRRVATMALDLLAS